MNLLFKMIAVWTDERSLVQAYGGSGTRALDCP